MLAAGPAATAGWRDFQRTAAPPPVVPEVIAVEAEPAAPAAEDAAAAEPALVLPTAGEAPAPDAGETAATGDASVVAAPCDEADEACSDALKALRSDSLAGIDIDIRVTGQPGRDYPCECRLEGETFEPRRFATTTFTWKAAGYCHKPLYFEHWNLERYGHSHGFMADSFLSAAHFFGRLPTLPYQMGVELPWECVYPLGYYRPGSCAPWTVPAPPVSARGLAVGAATATGLVFLLP